MEEKVGFEERILSPRKEQVEVAILMDYWNVYGEALKKISNQFFSAILFFYLTNKPIHINHGSSRTFEIKLNLYELIILTSQK